MHSKKPDSPNPKKKNNDALKSIAKYGSIAFQFGILSGLGFYGGYELDNYLGNEKPVFAALFSVIGLALAFYVVFKDLKKNK